MEAVVKLRQAFEKMFSAGVVLAVGPERDADGGSVK